MGLWDKSHGPRHPAFAQLKAPTEAEKAEIDKVLDSPEFKAELEARLKPYQTKVTWETLNKQVC